MISSQFSIPLYFIFYYSLDTVLLCDCPLQPLQNFIIDLGTWLEYVAAQDARNNSLDGNAGMLDLSHELCMTWLQPQHHQLMVSVVVDMLVFAVARSWQHTATHILQVSTYKGIKDRKLHGIPGCGEGILEAQICN